MAQHFIKATLSASLSGGAPIIVNAVATPGTAIHTATSAQGTDSIDEVYLWAGNISGSAANLTLYVGGESSENFKIHFRVPAGFNGPIPCLPGLPMYRSLAVTATASVTGVITVFGFINRIGGQTTS